AGGCGSRATGRSWASCSACSTSPTPASRSSPRRAERRLLRAQLEHQLVHVAPAPGLTRLGRADDRVARLVVVGRRVLADRVVAAADVAAALAHPQVDPPHPLRQALLAAVDRIGKIHQLDRIEMCALSHQPTKSSTQTTAASRATRISRIPCSRFSCCRLSRPNSSPAGGSTTAIPNGKRVLARSPTVSP